MMILLFIALHKTQQKESLQLRRLTTTVDPSDRRPATFTILSFVLCEHYVRSHLLLFFVFQRRSPSFWSTIVKIKLDKLEQDLTHKWLNCFYFSKGKEDSFLFGLFINPFIVYLYVS
jgi:hypothetical protein